MRLFGLVMLLGVVTWAVGCTFLIAFDEIPAPIDAGAGDARPDGVTDASDANPADGGLPAFPPPCDPTFPLMDVACNPSFPRPNCARNTGIFPAYPAPRGEDLVTCNGGTTPTCVQHCPFGCVTMPEGYPDTCDDCFGRPDGTYCMKDMRGVDGRNLGLAVDCKNAKTVGVHICGVGRCETECPRVDREPSCCI